MRLFEANGKQVLYGTAHFADARDDQSARMIASALNKHCTEPLPEDRQTPATIAPRHLIAQQFDEYACSCGMRWPADEGEEHP